MLCLKPYLAYALPFEGQSNQWLWFVEQQRNLGEVISHHF